MPVGAAASYSQFGISVLAFFASYEFLFSLSKNIKALIRKENITDFMLLNKMSILYMYKQSVGSCERFGISVAHRLLSTLKTNSRV